MARQPDPEGIVDPKTLCRTLLDESDRSFRQTEMYAAIAEAVDITVLETRMIKTEYVFTVRPLGIDWGMAPWQPACRVSPILPGFETGR